MRLKTTAAQKIAKAILSVQKKFADRMTKVSAKWKVQHQWIFLYMICFVFGSLSVVAIFQPFNEKNGFEKPAAIHLPKLLPQQQEKIIITDNEITRVHAFKQRLDGLSKTTEGKTKVDRFFNERPGLFDSLEKVEQLYYSQKK